MSFAGLIRLTDENPPKEDVMSSPTTITKVCTVVVPVSDQEQAIEFYVDKLGFEKRADVPFGESVSYRWVEVAPAGAEATVAIVPPPPGNEAGNKQTGVTFDCEDIEAAHAELKARGVDVDAEISRMGGPVPPMFWLRDPDKNSLLVVQTS